MSAKHSILDLPIGTAIYYSGDVANISDHGAIVAHRPATQWSSATVDIDLNDGRQIKAIAPCMFDKTPGQRFHLMTEWQVERAEKIAQMQAEYAAFQARRAATTQG